MHHPEDSGDKPLPEGARLPELKLRLLRTRGLWQIPHLDARSSLDILALQPPGSFLVTGFGLSLALTMNTDPHPEAVGTFRILETPSGLSLQGSQLSFPDLPELLAFLSTSRDILPQPLLLPPRALGPGTTLTEPLQIGLAQIASTQGALSVVNPLYLRDHGPWGPREEDASETAQKDTLAPQQLSPHRVSWIEGPPSPETEPEAWSLYSLEEGEAEPVGEPPREAEEAEEEGEEDPEPEDGVYHRVRSLARARGGFVAKQHRALQARLREAPSGPQGPEAGGDPATELLQDVRRLLTDLKEHLVRDPEVQAAYRARSAPPTGAPEDLEAVVEAAMCWVVLRPLQPLLWTKLRLLRARHLQQLQWRQEVMRARALQEARGPGAGVLQSPEAPVPSLTRRRIHARLARLHTAWTPHRKAALLLAICRDVYESLGQGGSKEPLGADDFLPALTEELLWSPDIEATQLDVEFLMEILDPAELLGETGYYLTTWFGALHHIAHFQPAASGPAPKGLSYEARASIRLWQRRRTLHASGRTGASPSMQLEKPWGSLEEEKPGAESRRLPAAASSLPASVTGDP
ncbi:ras and Rab interactor-like protein [Gracilinanus agilis]|uniref:ras and Rab interactor-like protein n=1 Tax=Gracilinanus agilis TaxID=191870 RepID=UPI001CFC89D0|nr:ras and Rab interactor-like protein [Gracilinanus agilis]